MTAVVERADQAALMVAEYGAHGRVHFLDQPGVYRNHRAGFHTAARQICDMLPEQRLNALLALLEDAAGLGRRYVLFMRWTYPLHVDITDPAMWIRETPLFRGLTIGLPTKRNQLDVLDRRAAHADSCPTRVGYVCNCDPRPVTDRTVLGVIGDVARAVRV